LETQSADYKTVLDILQKEVFQFLKPIGFKKQGRTFNRTVDTGINQVINFQSGQFPLGDSYEIPGLRENLYGKFTINLGVCVSELYDILVSGKTKTFFQEYDCQIRTRLPVLLYGKDQWWNLNDNINETSNEMITGLKTKGFAWLELFENREKICQNLTIQSEEYAPASKLKIALIILQTDKIKGARLLKEYYESLDNKSHKDYVVNLAHRLNLEGTDD
jgi:hypothetical protein